MATGVTDIIYCLNFHPEKFHNVSTWNFALSSVYKPYDASVCIGGWVSPVSPSPSELCLSAVHLLGLGTLAYGGHRFCKGAANAGLKHLAIGHQTVLVDTSIPLFSVF